MTGEEWLLLKLVWMYPQKHNMFSPSLKSLFKDLPSIISAFPNISYAKKLVISIALLSTHEVSYL